MGVISLSPMVKINDKLPNAQIENIRNNYFAGHWILLAMRRLTEA